MIRVLAGIAKGRKIKVLPISSGKRLRPLNARAKGALFNILQTEIADAGFLDLFAGSGSVGIEALSRGAKLAIFVEQDPGISAGIRENLGVMGFEDRCEVYVLSAHRAIRLLHQKKAHFDIIFLGAPYGSPDLEEALGMLGEENLLEPDGILIAEHHKGHRLEERYGLLSGYRQASYGDTVLSFFRQHSV